MKARNHPLKDRFRWFKELATAITTGDFYGEMSDDDLTEALNVGLWRAGADKRLRFEVVRAAGGVPIAELHGLDTSWVGPPQEAFFRLAELGESVGTEAVRSAFASLAPRAEHSGEPRFERPEDNHEPRPGWHGLLRREREVR